VWPQHEAPAPPDCKQRIKKNIVVLSDQDNHGDNEQEKRDGGPETSIAWRSTLRPQTVWRTIGSTNSTVVMQIGNSQTQISPA
jgi:hypothetical protein